MRRLLPLLFLLPLAACGGSGATPRGTAHGPAFAVEKRTTAGPVSLTIRLSQSRLGLAEHLILEQEVRAEAGFTAELPEFAPGEFEGFGVTATQEDPPAIEGGRTILRRRLTLEPERSGELTIPRFEAWFTKQGSKRDDSLTSEPLPVRVDPIADAAKIGLPQPRPLIAGASDHGGGLSPLWALLLVLPLGAGVAWYFVRCPRRAPPVRPAHEIAYEALRRLAAAGYLERGEIEPFFVALSAILREYIERRFGLRAPERTTEEFLDEAARDRRLAGHREALARFLGLADRVKFARFAPAQSDVQSAFDAAKTFLEATRAHRVEEELLHA